MCDVCDLCDKRNNNNNDDAKQLKTRRIWETTNKNIKKQSRPNKKSNSRLLAAPNKHQYGIVRQAIRTITCIGHAKTMDALIGSDGLLTSLLNLGGVTVPARARFIASTLATTTYSSLTFGLFSGLIGAATPLGPLAPFLSGCWMGYTFGVYAVWRSGKMAALSYAERYPKLLAHALELEFGVWVPKECVDAPPISAGNGFGTDNGVKSSGSSNTLVESRRSGSKYLSHPLALWICNGGVGRLSFAILAAQECQHSIRDLEREQRNQIVENNYKEIAGSEK